jgi:WD40 repeat protein
VLCVAFSPDGKTVASGGREGGLYLWDARTGKEIAALPRHRLGVQSITFSPDGKLLASSGGDPALRLWEIAAGKERRIFSGQGGEVASVCFSADGKTLASGDDSGTARLWDVATGRERIAINHPRYALASVSLSPDGKILASGSCRDGVRLWNAQTGKMLRNLIDSDRIDNHVAFTRDGKRLLVTGSRIALWDVQTGKKMKDLARCYEGIPVAAVSADGRLLAIAGFADRRDVRVWNLNVVDEPICIPGGERGASSLAFAPDGKTLALGTFEGRLCLVDITTGKDRIEVEGHLGPVNGLGFAPDGKTLATSGDRTVRLWDMKRFRQRDSLQHDEDTWSVAFSLDGRLLACGTGNPESERRQGAVYLWDAATRKRQATIRDPAESQCVRSLSFSSDSELLAWAGNCKEAQPRVWHVPGSKQLTPLSTWERIGATVVAFAPDGRTLATTGRSNDIHIYQLPTWRERRVLEGNHGTVRTIAFSPDGLLLASAGWDSAIRVWETPTGHEIRRWTGHQGGIEALVFFPDSRRLAVAGVDGVIRIWDVLGGELRSRLEGHRGEVTCLAVSPDGKLLASGSRDGTVLLWRVDNLPALTVTPLPASELDALWDTLGSTNAAEGYRAVGTLASMPQQSVAFLEERVFRSLPTDAQVQRWIEELDHRRYPVRQQAERQLEQWTHLTAPAMRKALEGGPSLHVRRRIEDIVSRLDWPVGHFPEAVRLQRVVRALELAGTPRARHLLARLVDFDFPDARAALMRLQQRR